MDKSLGSRSPVLPQNAAFEQYVDTSSLPIPNQKVIDKYFSENAQQQFNEKYRNLLHQAELLPGGKQELLSIVKQNGDPSMVVKKAKEKLLRYGVLTPGQASSGTTTPTANSSRLGPFSLSYRPQTANAAMLPKAFRNKRPKTATATSGSSAAAFMARKLERLSKEEAKQAESPVLPRMGTSKTSRSVPPSPTLGRIPPLRNRLAAGPPLVSASNAVKASINSSSKDKFDFEEEKEGIFIDDIDDDNDNDSDDLVHSSFFDNQTIPSSPRSIFLAGCVRYGLPPRSIAVLRKRISPVMNLAHMSIGNQTAILLAEAMDRMPYLQTLNLADNNLDDSGLSAIIRCVAKHSTLEVLDISQNTISFGAAKELGNYVGSANCFLKSLRLSSAGIDDKECASFVKVLMKNRMLKELDLSKNLLGKDENLNVVMPDFLTGGESLAHLLRYSTCPLETLNLHWNMIRLEGAEILCDSIRNNSYLTDLNLSYNSLGSRAVCLLGMALIDNNRLRRLNLANNGIDSQGAITLSVGMRENQSLRNVILSGNPIGDQGARALMKVMIQEGHRLTVETEDCDIATRQNALTLHIDNPLGDYLLDLHQPHERAIAYELFDIIARDANIDVSIFDLYLSDSSGEKVARNTSNSKASANSSKNARPKSPTKDSSMGNNNNATSNSNTTVDDGIFDPLAATIRHLGQLTASYTVARFDEPKKRYVLSDHEREEESFFAALAPLHDVSPVILLKTVRHYMIENSDSFPCNQLHFIFDDLLHRRRRFKDNDNSKEVKKGKLTSTDDVSALNMSKKPGLSTSDNLDEMGDLSINRTTSINCTTANRGNMLAIELPSITVTRGYSTDDGDESFITTLSSPMKKETLSGSISNTCSVDESKLGGDIMHMPKENVVHKLAEETRRLLDPRHSGVIDNDVFIEYITERVKGARDRLRQIRNLPRCAAIQVVAPSASSKFALKKNLHHISQQSNPTTNAATIARKMNSKHFVRYIPPVSGWLRLRLVEAFHMSSPLDDEDEDEQAPADEERKVNDEEDRSRGGYALTMSQALALIEDVQSMCRANPIPLLLYAVDSTWLRLQEAVLLFSFANKRVDDSTAVVSRILLRMQSGYESRRLVHIYVGDDTMKLRRLKQRLGSGYNTMLNQYSGFYSLDLSNELDRMCLKRLIEKSVRDASSRRLRGLGDTSQHGHWSCFRNEYHRMVSLSGPTVGSHAVKHVIEKSKQQQQQQMKNAIGTTSAIGVSNIASKTAVVADLFDDEKKVTTASGAVGVQLADGTWVSDVNAFSTAYVDLDKLVSPAFCTPIPQRGRLEFDFVNIERPHPKHCHPVHDDVILDCLLLSRLLSEDDIDWAIEKLRKYQKAARRNVIADGNAIYKVDVGQALQINDLVYKMYTILPHRQSSRKKVFAREAITSQPGVMSLAQIDALAAAQSAAMTEEAAKKMSIAAGSNITTNLKASKRAIRQSVGTNAPTAGMRRRNNNTSNMNVNNNNVNMGGGGVNKTVSFADDYQNHNNNKLVLELPLGNSSLEDSMQEDPKLSLMLPLSPSLDVGDDSMGGIIATTNTTNSVAIDEETEEAVKNTIAALFGGGDCVDMNAISDELGSPSMSLPDSAYSTCPQTPSEIDSPHTNRNPRHKPLTFRSFVKQGARAHHKLRRWGTRMQEIIVDGTGSDEYKAAALLEFFEAELAPYWLECRQVALILELMAPYGTAKRWDYGSYRVEWIVQVFDRIVDLHHFEFIASVLNAEEYAAILCRIGILNIFNPCKCEGAWSLDLGRWEERQIAKILIHITIDEPGQNWPFKLYQFQRGFVPIPGWELVRRWVTADGLPSKGMLTVDMFTGHGLRINNCAPDIMLRQMLCALTLPSQRDYIMEIEIMERDNIYHPEPEGNKVEYEEHQPRILNQSFFGNNTGQQSTANSSNNNSSNHSSTANTPSSLAAFRKIRTKRSMIGRQSASGNAQSSSTYSGYNGISTPTSHNNSMNVHPNYVMRRRIKRIVPIIKYSRLRSQLDILRLLSRGTGTEEERARHREQIDKQESVITKAEENSIAVTSGGSHNATTTTTTTTTTSKSIRALHAILATMDNKYHDLRHFTVEDCNEHLRKEIEATWQYVSNPKCRPETWV